MSLPSQRVAEQIRALLAKDLYLEARELAATAIRRFPDDPSLQVLWRVFDNHGKAQVVPGKTGPETDAEFAWLREPPEWAHGKWVALMGSEAVAVADTLRELTDSLRDQEFSHRPLVHRID